MKAKNVWESDNYSSEEKYIEACFHQQTNILEVCAQLEKITVYLRRFDKNYFTKNQISQSDFIQYHLEVYTNKIFTLFELILAFINTVYELDLKPRQCNLKNIKKKLNEQNIINLLISLSDNLNSWRDIRNKTVHHNKFTKDNEFHRLSMEESYWIHCEKLGIEPKVDLKFTMPKHFVDWALREERREKIKFIKQNNLGLNSYIHVLNTRVMKQIKRKMAMPNKSKHHTAQ
ncbi:Cthe_2314 family HEPN domain-containing protein [Marinifilum breve]|nr:Cthe_2314 family HEPN domain-containing protein [Marinifilum breve]